MNRERAAIITIFLCLALCRGLPAQDGAEPDSLEGAELDLGGGGKRDRVRAEPDPRSNKIDLGAGMEWNVNAHKNFAGGAALGLNYNLPHSFAIGLTATASGKPGAFTTVEAAALARRYFSPKFPHSGFFAQADAGVLFYAEKEYREGKIRTLVSGGGRVGFRIPLGWSFYLEPYARGGYPFLFSVGLAAGARLAHNGEKPSRDKRIGNRPVRRLAGGAAGWLSEGIPEGVPEEPTPQPTQGRYYIVQWGDTANIISEKVYGTTYAWDQIAAVNRVQDADRIVVGQRLYIPPFRTPDGEFSTGEPVAGRYYIIRRGDTLESLSVKAYGDESGAGAIMEANNMARRMLYYGRIIFIPEITAVGPQE